MLAKSMKHGFLLRTYPLKQSQFILRVSIPYDSPTHLHSDCTQTENVVLREWFDFLYFLARKKDLSYYWKTVGFFQRFLAGNVVILWLIQTQLKVLNISVSLSIRTAHRLRPLLLELPRRCLDRKDQQHLHFGFRSIKGTRRMETLQMYLILPQERSI